MSIAVTPYRGKTWRIISTRYPPVHIFEEIAGPEDYAALNQLEALTNDRLRNECGSLALVPPEECVFGAGAGYIMAAFTHLGAGSRFSDGSYGVYYAARNIATAIAETTYHRAQFLACTRQRPQGIDMRVLTAQVDAALHDIQGASASMPDVYHPQDYSASQAWARPLRIQGSYGIVFDSVRQNGGTCFAVFRPRALSRCMQAQHLRYYWNGQAITHVAELKAVA